MERSMIRVADALQQTDRASVEQPGGFAWWYADIVDEHGNGAVVIWSWGLPFLPGLLDATRRGKAQAAEAWPSLNVAFYRDGRQEYYLLQQFAPEEASWNEEQTAEGRNEVWRFGATTIRRTIETGRVTLVAALDCRQEALPSLTGLLRLEGAVAQQFSGDETAGQTGHCWGVVAGQAAGSCSLQTESETLEVRGIGYHDRNWAPAQLDQLGIASWTWLRVSSTEETLVLYLLWPEDGGAARVIGRSMATDGTVRRIAPEQVRSSGARRDRYGVSMVETITVGGSRGDLVLSLASPVERGPFYLRAAVADGSGSWRGWAETVVPKRIDGTLERPLVRMAVHRRHGGNSFWLPLFAGLRRSRIARLFRRRNYVAVGE